MAYLTTDGSRVTGDAANITAKIRKDFGARTATNDTNPTEAEDGYYDFDLTAAETNAYHIELYPESATGSVLVVPVPGSYTPQVPGSGAVAVAGSTGSPLSAVPISVLDYSVGPVVKLYVRDTVTQEGTLAGYSLSLLKVPNYTFDITGLADGDYDVYLAAPSTLEDIQPPWALRVVNSEAFLAETWGQIQAWTGNIYGPNVAASASRADSTTIALFVGETQAYSINVYDADGDAVPLAGKTLELTFDNRKRDEILVITSGNITVSSNVATFSPTSAITGSVGEFFWALRDTANYQEVLAAGVCRVSYAARNV